MYGKLDDKMNRDDGVPLADPAWRKAEKEKDYYRAGGLEPDPFWSIGMSPFTEEQKANIRLECLRIADQSFSGDATRVVDVAEEYAAFVLGEEENGELLNDNLINRLSRFAEECRNAGV